LHLNAHLDPITAQVELICVVSKHKINA